MTTSMVGAPAGSCSLATENLAVQIPVLRRKRH